MSLRVKLALSFFVLAVLPLTGIVLYSYDSARRALRSSNEASASAMAAELDERMEAIQSDLRRRFERLEAVRWDARPLNPVDPVAPPTMQEVSPGTDAGAQKRLVQSLLGELGDSAGLIDRIEFVPAPEAPPTAPGSTAEPPGPPVAPQVLDREEQLVIDIEGLDTEEVEELAGPVVEFFLRQAHGWATGDPDAEKELEESMEAFSLDMVDLAGESLAGHLPTGEAAPRPEGMGGEGAPSPEASDTPVRPVSPHRLFRRWIAVIEHQSEAHQRSLNDPEGQTIRIEDGEARGVGGVDEDQRIAAREAERQATRSAQARVSRLPDSRLVERHKAIEREQGRAWQALGLPVIEGDAPIGELRAKIRGDELVRRVLARTRREQGEIPFAIDAEGRIFTAEETDLALIGPLIPGTENEEGRRQALDRGWVIARSGEGAPGENDAEAEADLPEDLEFGIARPIGEPLAEVSRAARRSFGFGLALIVLALVGVLPLSHHVTRNLRQVTVSAGRIAEGELSTRVPVRSHDEVGQLARAFNHMAGRLVEHEKRLVEDERRRHGEEMERQLLEAEYSRKSQELEEARQFQLSLLPKRLPEREDCELAVLMEVAKEVGGDYYDLVEHDDVLVLAVGDATGHGARAGTMVTVTKSLVSSYGPGEGPATFLRRASETIHRMDLGRMAMALLIAEWRQGELRWAAAGMPPVLIHRAQDDRLEEGTLPGLPLGSRLAGHYEERRLELAPGDTVLFESDGFPELLDPSGEPMGYERAHESFLRAARGGATAQQVVDHLRRDAEAWQGGPRPNDDVTFVVLRAT